MNAVTLPVAKERADPDTGKLGMWIFLYPLLYLVERHG